MSSKEKENADYLMQRAVSAGITDKKELANFMGQMQVECGGFSHMNEELNYSGEQLLKVFHGRNGLSTIDQSNAIVAGGPETVANAIYGGEWGKNPAHLGNTEPGDGWKYHGRGYVQLTGRANYERIGRELGLDLINHPELASNRETAAKIAIHYWESRVVPHHHQQDIKGACRDINGGEQGLPERERATASWQTKLAHDYVSGTPDHASHSGGAGELASSPEQTPITLHHPAHGASPHHEADHNLLKQGANGHAVHDLQANLAHLGYTDARGHALPADGHFGIDTRHAMERFQHDHGLAVDDIAGPKTLEALHQQGLAKAIATPHLDHPSHPDHALYQQVREVVHRLDAQHGRASDQRSDNLAAALVVAARHEGMHRVDQVLLSEDATRAFAVQGKLDSPLRQLAHVETLQALNTSIAQSSDAWKLAPQPLEPQPQAVQLVPQQAAGLGR